MPSCKKCDKLPEATDIGWKRHMTTEHGGFSKDELESAGVKMSKGDEARFLGGFKTSAEVTSAAPDSESGSPGNSGTAVSSSPGPKRKTRAEDAAEEKRRAEAIDLVGKTLMKQLAAAPYTAWAMLAADPALQLTREELKEISDAYFLLAQTMQPDFSKPWWLIMAAMGANMAAITKRVDFSQFMTSDGPENPGEETVEGAGPEPTGAVPATGFFRRFRNGPTVIDANEGPKQ